MHHSKRDNLVDIAGYAENAHLCAAAEEAYREAMTEPSPQLADLPMKPHVGDYKAEFTTPLPKTAMDGGTKENAGHESESMIYGFRCVKCGDTRLLLKPWERTCPVSGVDVD